MSREPCTTCGASRGLAQYPDGSFCHACKEKIKAKSMIKRQRDKLILPLPETAVHRRDTYISETQIKKALGWLRRYHVYKMVDRNYSIAWSYCIERILFFFRLGDRESFCWMRSMKDTCKNKWLLAGERQLLYLRKLLDDCTETETLCIVEDPISAIRLRDHVDTISLCGTNFTSNVNDIRDLIPRYKQIITWFDGDIAGIIAAEDFNKRFKMMCSIRNIRTKEDPKCYSYQEIEEILK